MYYIYDSNSNLITNTESPYYIKLHSNGRTLIPATKKEAQGINIDGIVYTLLGQQPLKADSEVVHIVEYDAGNTLMSQDNIIDDLLASLVATESEIATLNSIEDHQYTYEHYKNLYQQGRVFKDGLQKAISLGLLTAQQVDYIINGEPEPELEEETVE